VIVASAEILPSIKDLCASIRDIMAKIQVEIDKLQQIEKMEIVREQLSKKSARQVSVVVRMQAVRAASECVGGYWRCAVCS
jgi:hypothetical protein